jgi:hypothetical protein
LEAHDEEAGGGGGEVSVAVGTVIMECVYLMNE